ncbi:MAG: signal peptide peptidase SppA [Arcobacteraceae bacterium]|jgi:protease-4|nr:signal peptide peptidase SppA [Arcobacteraceae bacterium]
MNFFKILFTPITVPIEFIQNHFKATLLVLIVFFIYQSSNPDDLVTPNLKTIHLSGAIMDASFILEEIESAKTDENIKGILLDVNSPGGAVAPSVEIAYAIKELNTLKPVVAYASGTMASGSYYSSIWASKIIANPGSMVGSIGVIMQSVDASELMSKLGVKTQTVKVGTYKEAGTPTRKWTKEEKAELDKVIGSTYEMFVSDVASARKLKVEDKNKFADAHIFTAIQAKNVGLVDSVGTMNEAKRMVQTMAKVKEPIWDKKDKMDKFLEKFANEAISKIGLNSTTLVAY